MNEGLARIKAHIENRDHGFAWHDAEVYEGRKMIYTEFLDRYIWSPTKGFGS